MHSLRIIRKEELSTSSWNGGTTTQLAIYPENASYAERNFKWRISTATVEIEESTFTSLPNITRIIMPLKGQMHLIHEGHRETLLHPFEQDTFMGDWNTKCYGKASDFNLMITEGEGVVNTINIAPLSKYEAAERPVPTRPEWQYLSLIFYFMAETTIELPDQENFNMHPGDVLIWRESFQENEKNRLPFDLSTSQNNETQVIQTCVFHN